MTKSPKRKASHDVINNNGQLLMAYASKSCMSAYIPAALSERAARSRSIFFASSAKIHGSTCCSSLEIPLHVQHRAASATMDAAAIPISPVKGWQLHVRIQEAITKSHEQRHVLKMNLAFVHLQIWESLKIKLSWPNSIAMKGSSPQTFGEMWTPRYEAMIDIWVASHWATDGLC